ncbi:universal stress protein [Natronorubrum sulfidifaciens]|uniref:UspA domain-containing protein n=1 Tax=Natronorubrum sulfidifaciens JCM 14089 TaxID=1230460 RepID=L9WB51_9EURY|nr:universal stress protein [Natronorubrum sulfidifaciens]ELY46699.1 UspA domain-containing protein [Natronorubrum sulfidifaciens JCM 14089]
MAVLVAYDGSAPARKAVEHAFETFPDEEIILLRVVEAAEGSTGAGIELLKDMFREREKKISEGFGDEVSNIISTDDVEFRTETAVGQPARAVVAFAEENDEVEHVIIGSHGRDGVSRVLLGSVAETIVRRSPVPVTVVR